MRRFAILSRAIRPAKLCAAVLLAALGGSACFGQTAYRFINIADTTGPFGSVGDELSINNRGVVAFRATDGSGPGIFTGHGGPVQLIAHSSGPYSYFDSLTFGGLDINDGGMVAFIAHMDSGHRGVFTSDGGPARTVALAGAGAPFRGMLGHAFINNNGAVAFFGTLQNEPSGILVDSGGTIATLPDAEKFGDERVVAFNDAGEAAVSTVSAGVGSLAFYHVTEAGVTKLVDRKGPFTSIHPQAMNNSGIHAFIGRRAGGSWGVFTTSGANITTLVEETSPLKAWAVSVAINDAGVVAFTGDSGIYTANGSDIDEVIGTGDALFGSTIQTLTGLTGYQDINNRGDVAFKYRLANGVEGIAVASVVPEPSCLGAAVVAYLALMGTAGRKWR